jgi:hypothetical protein
MLPQGSSLDFRVPNEIPDFRWNTYHPETYQF